MWMSVIRARVFHQKIKQNKYAVPAVLVIWVLAVGIGWMALSRYENIPGQAQASPEHWPDLSKIPSTAGLPTLLMFVHPHCPCSRASMNELSLIMAHCQNKVRTQVVFVKPAEFTQDWIKTDLWNSAIHIPGVEAIVDNEGSEAKIFHADVSGQTMLYDGQGNLVFSGGITSSRGHEGDNEGRDAIVLFLTKGAVSRKQTPFFGCRLFNH